MEVSEYFKQNPGRKGDQPKSEHSVTGNAHIQGKMLSTTRLALYGTINNTIAP